MFEPGPEVSKEQAKVFEEIYRDRKSVIYTLDYMSYARCLYIWLYACCSICKLCCLCWCNKNRDREREYDSEKKENDQKHKEDCAICLIEFSVDDT